jgi:hypothetical protein
MQEGCARQQLTSVVAVDIAGLIHNVVAQNNKNLSSFRVGLLQTWVKGRPTHARIAAQVLALALVYTYFTLS